MPPKCSTCLEESLKQVKKTIAGIRMMIGDSSGLPEGTLIQNRRLEICYQVGSTFEETFLNKYKAIESRKTVATAIKLCQIQSSLKRSREVEEQLGVITQSEVSQILARLKQYREIEEHLGLNYTDEADFDGQVDEPARQHRRLETQMCEMEF